MSPGRDKETTQIEVEKPGGSGWGKVAVMAAVGFAVGVFWPRLFGMRPGPSAPPETIASAQPQDTAPVPSPQGAHAQPPSSPVAAALVAPLVPTASSAPTVPAAVSVGRGYPLSCRSPDGTSAKGTACGPIGGIDSVFVPRLRKLAQCGSAGAASGKLQVVVSLDFDRNSVGLELGKGSTVADPDALTTCAKTAIRGASIAPITHDEARYTVLYSVNFGAAPADSANAPVPVAPARAGVAATNPAPAAAGGSAQVVYETGIVRDAPHKAAKIVSRLSKGSEVHLGAAQDGWYEVHFGPDFASQGWLYGGAVGR